MKHQIHASHIGIGATHADAVRLADIITVMGYASEATALDGAKSTIIDPHTGDYIQIPDEVWWEAIAQLSHE
jgi:hypothetical protein